VRREVVEMATVEHRRRCGAVRVPDDLGGCSHELAPVRRIA
jgi:hypothetical protein